MYELFYWSGIQGRGELVRLVLEDAGVPYVDVAREGEDGNKRLGQALRGELAPYVFAVPALRDGNLVLPQSIAIMRYLGERHGLAPADDAGRAQAEAIALTIADLSDEAHDTHHPLSVEDYYDNQKEAALVRAKVFREKRMPRFLGYLEGLLAHNKTGYLVGASATYADLAAFQVVEGLTYAFPRAMARITPQIPHLLALRDRIAARPKLAAYLASPRRQAHNNHDLYRRYPELDD